MTKEEDPQEPRAGFPLPWKTQKTRIFHISTATTVAFYFFQKKQNRKLGWLG
jgi:hypothetical protein